jgi:uncharacterized membrane protein (UPF0127 family)
MNIRLTRFACHAAFATVLAATACGAGKSPTTPASQNTVTINNATVTVTLAATCAARTNGLMGVTNLGANSGMLFVFAEDKPRWFWMKDTPTALSIAFFDANRMVVYLADMPANSLTTYPPGVNAPLIRYALEVNQGWFAAHGVTLGMTATFTLPSSLTIEPDCP